jgi:hypothetical protein
MKADLAGEIDPLQKQAQVMVDSVFSFGEPIELALQLRKLSFAE